MSFFSKKSNKQDSQSNLNCPVNLKSAYQYFPIPYQSLDVDGNLLDVNLAWLKALGYARRDVIGKNFSEFLSTPEKEVFKLNFNGFRKKGAICDVPYLLRKKDDTWISVEFNGTIEYDDNGEFKLTHCMFQDVTEKKIAEEKIIKSEKKYKELFEGAPIALYEIDFVNKKFIEVNDAMCVLLGYSRYELLGKSSQSIMTKRSQIKVLKYLVLIKLGKKAPRITDLEVKTKTGSIIQARVYVNFLKKHGKIVGARIVAQDITELKKNQEKVSKNEKKFKMIFDSSPAVIVLLDKKGRLLDINKKVHDWLGYERDELIGKNMINLPILAPGTKSIIIKNFAKRMLGKSIKAYDVNFKNKNGELRAGRITASPIKNEQDKIIGDLVMLSDITQEKKAQSALRDSEEQAHLITENTNDLVSITDFSLKTKFLYLNLAHEKTLGWNPKDFIGKPALDLVHPDDKKNLQHLLGKYLKEKTFNIFRKKVSKITENVEYRVRDSQDNWQLLASTVNFVGNRLVFVSRNITKKRKAEEKLIKSEENLKKAEAIGGVGSWEYDLVTNKLWGSDQAKKIFGLVSESDIFSMEAVEELIQEKEKAHQALEDLLKKNKPYDIEYKIATKDLKKMRPVRSIAEIVFDEKQKPIKVVGTIRDVSEKKKSEKALKKSEEEYRSTLNELLVGVVVHAPDTRILLSNPEASNILGLSPKELLDKEVPNSTCNFVYTDLSPMKEADYPVNKVISTKKPFSNYEFGVVRSDKKNITWVNANATPMFYSNNRLNKIIVNFVDITERKQVEEKMLNSAKEWSKTFDSMSDGISLHSPDHIIINANQSLCNLLGKTKEELVGEKCFSIFHDRNQPISECPMKYTLETKKEKQIEFFEPKFNKWLSIYTSPIINKKGQIEKVIHVVRDITQRKEDGVEIVKRNLELEKLNKLTIGRELKMIELKKKMKELENK